MLDYYLIGFDSTYLLFAIPTFIFAIWAQFSVKSTFKKFSKERMYNGLTGAEAARAILDGHGLHSVRVEHVPGNLSDHYDPRDNVIRLSDGVYGKSTVAAVGVAAHEAGHALQHADSYAPIKLREAIIPVTQIGSTLSMPMVFLGLIIPAFDALISVGIILFAFVTIFQLVTLPVEFNASSRAVKILSNGHYVNDEEKRGVKRVLSAAAMTYVAALATSLVSLLRLVLIARGRD